MKRLALALFAAATCLRAGPETALVEKVYAKLAQAFSAGEALGQQGDYLLLAHPGLAVTDSFVADPFQVATLADQIPLPTRYYVTAGRTLSSTYQTILGSAETSNFVDQSSRQKALEARRRIYDKNRPGEPTAAYAAYLKYRAAFAAAQDALNLARAEQKTSGKPVSDSLQKAVEAAEADWKDKGNRQLIEDAQRDLAAFSSANVRALFNNLQSDMAGWAKRGNQSQEWYPVYCVPPTKEWLAPQDWKPFSVTQSERNLAPANPAVPLEGAPGAAPAVTPDFLGSVTISMETKRVDFARPWLDASIFKSSGWRLWRDSGFRMVSTGNPADREPGIMPLIVTGVLLSRKLALTGSWSGGAPAVKELGPFAVDKATVQNGQLTLACDGVQILGFFCTTVPKSPNPDPSKDFRAP